jgi:hypothetical protein
MIHYNSLQNTFQIKTDTYGILCRFRSGKVLLKETMKIERTAKRAIRGVTNYLYKKFKKRMGLQL